MAGGHPRLKLLGVRFGRLEVIAEAEAAKYSRWRCRCDCGGEIVATAHTLRNGYTKSCGCLRRETVSANLRTLHAERRVGPAKQYGRPPKVVPIQDAGPLSQALGYGGLKC